MSSDENKNQIERIHIEKLEKRQRTNLINCLSGFKPANLVGSRSSEGISNLAMISSAVHLGADPALMGFVFRPDSVPRDTLQNIRQMSDFTLNHVTEDFFKQAHQTSARYENSESEFVACNIGEEYLDGWSAPFVKESRIKIALKMVREIPITENGTHFIVASIERIYLPADCVNRDGFVDLEKAGSVAVSGLDSYHRPQKIARLSYAKPDKGIEVL